MLKCTTVQHRSLSVYVDSSFGDCYKIYIGSLQTAEAFGNISSYKFYGPIDSTTSSPACNPFLLRAPPKAVSLSFQLINVPRKCSQVWTLLLLDFQGIYQAFCLFLRNGRQKVVEFVWEEIAQNILSHSKLKSFIDGLQFKSLCRSIANILENHPCRDHH